MVFFNISLYPFVHLSSCASHISKTPSEEQSRQNKNLCLIQQSVPAFKKEYLPARASPVSLGAVWQAELPIPTLLSPAQQAQLGFHLLNCSFLKMRH